MSVRRIVGWWWHWPPLVLVWISPSAPSRMRHLRRPLQPRSGPRTWLPPPDWHRPLSSPPSVQATTRCVSHTANSRQPPTVISRWKGPAIWRSFARRHSPSTRRPSNWSTRRRKGPPAAAPATATPDSGPGARGPMRCGCCIGVTCLSCRYPRADKKASTRSVISMAAVLS